MMKKQTSIFPSIVVAILLHALAIWVLLHRPPKEPLPDIIEVAFDSPTPLPEPEPEPLPEPEPPKVKNMVLDEEPPQDKVASDENSDVGVKGADEVQKAEVEGEKYKYKEFGRNVSINTRKMWESYKSQKGNKWKGQGLEVKMFFRVSSDGSISGARVSKSSGNAAFDAFALEFCNNLKVDKFTGDMIKDNAPKQRIVINLVS
jgi:TonB family protein